MGSKTQFRGHDPHSIFASRWQRNKETEIALRGLKNVQFCSISTKAEKDFFPTKTHLNFFCYSVKNGFILENINDTFLEC